MSDSSTHPRRLHTASSSLNRPSGQEDLSAQLRCSSERTLEKLEGRLNNHARRLSELSFFFFRANLDRELRKNLEQALRMVSAKVQYEFSARDTNVLVVSDELLRKSEKELDSTTYAAQTKPVARQNRIQSPHPQNSRLGNRARRLLTVKPEPSPQRPEKRMFSLGAFLNTNSMRVVSASALLKLLEGWRLGSREWHQRYTKT